MSTSSRRKSALPAIAASSSSAFTSTSSFMSSDTIHSSSAMSTSSLKNHSVALSDTSHSSFTSSAAFRRKARKDHYEKKAEQRELQRLNGVGDDGTDLSYDSGPPLEESWLPSSAKSSKSHSNSDDWQCHKCNKMNPSSKSKCGGKRNGRPCQAWMGGKALGVRKRGEDSHFHISKGGSGGSNTNARRELRGGSVIFLTLQGANNSENKMVVHLGSELRSLLPEPYNNRDNGMVVNIGDKAVDKICDIFSILRGHPVSERRAAYIRTLFEVGCHVVTGVTIRGKTQDSIQEKIIVFLPDGTPMTEADVAKLKFTNTSGCIISLCKEDLCFGIPEEGKRTCSEHTVEVRLLSQHLSHFSFQHVLMFFIFMYTQECTQCGSSEVHERGMCQPCYKNANNLQRVGEVCNFPSCSSIIGNGDTNACGKYCTRKCEKRMTNARKGGTICKKCNGQFVDERLLCTDCWKKPFTLCKYCQENITRKGVQCNSCEKKKKENKTKHKQDPSWFTEMLQRKSGK